MRILRLNFEGWRLNPSDEQSILTRYIIQNFRESGNGLDYLAVFNLHYKGNLNEFGVGTVEEGGKMVTQVVRRGAMLGEPFS